MNNKNKPTIEDIVISSEDLAELNRILNGGYSKGVKKQAMARIGYRGCTICGETPSKKVSYQVGDSEQPATRLEYLCNSCWEKSGLGNNKVCLTATNGIDKTIAVVEKNYTKGAQ